MPVAAIISSSGLETAPQTRMSTPSSARRAALHDATVSVIRSSWRLVSRPFSMSTTSKRSATSKTGETLPRFIGIATFIAREGSIRRANRGVGGWATLTHYSRGGYRFRIRRRSIAEACKLHVSAGAGVAGCNTMVSAGSGHLPQGVRCRATWPSGTRCWD